METPIDFLSGVFANIDQVAEPGSAAATTALDFANLKAHVEGSTIWQYSGSLTTPSCDEDVAWNVVENPVFISPTMYRAVKSVVKFNSRFTQNEPGEVNLLDEARRVLEVAA